MDRVEAGEEIIITRHGEPVAKLAPIKPIRDQQAIQALIEEIRATRKGRRLGGVSIKELVNEGRKY